MGESGIDLREFQNSEKIDNAFSLLVSGKLGYKTVIERKKDLPRCPKCSKILEGNEKFCPDCGAETGFASAEESDN